MFYYLEEAGFLNPWTLWNTLKVLASGDDVVDQIKDNLQGIHDKIYQLTTRTKESQKTGLGQCVKDIYIGKFDEIDFCSKWSFSHGTADSLMITRDYSKFLKEK